MPTEAGDMKLLGNFRKLIDLLTAEPNYNPANPTIIKTALGSSSHRGAHLSRWCVGQNGPKQTGNQ